MILFWKNKAGAKVDPATEASLAAIRAKTDLLTLDDVANANLKVRAAAGKLKLKNATATGVNPATDDTLALIRAQTDKFQFDASHGLMTTGTAPALASAVQLKNVSKATITPIQNEEVQLWKRMVKILESHATVDAGNLQKISLDSFGSTVTGVDPSGDGIPLVTMASDLVRVIPGISTPTTFMGAGNQVYQDVARNAYARSIRRNLRFS